MACNEKHNNIGDIFRFERRDTLERFHCFDAILRGHVAIQLGPNHTRFHDRHPYAPSGHLLTTDSVIATTPNLVAL